MAEKMQKCFRCAIVVALLLSLFSGCKTKYVSVPEYHKEYVARTDTFMKMDSLLIKDSVFVLQRGDTVYVNKVSYRDRWRNMYKVKHDTIIKEDSIPYPICRELTKNERRLMDIGRASVILGMMAGLVFIASFIFYRNKKC